jgi:hypothetical protein
MTPTYASKNGGRRYGYYVCTNAQQRGRKKCPSRSLPSSAIEQWVLECLQEIARETDAKQPSPFPEAANWDTILPEERRRLLHTWIAKVDYDGSRDRATITFAASSQKDPPKNSRKGKPP